MQIPPRNIFSFGILYQNHVVECIVQRRCMYDEIYHVVIFNGKEYTMRIDFDGDFRFHFTSSYMNSYLRGCEPMINKLMDQYDFFR